MLPLSLLYIAISCSTSFEQQAYVEKPVNGALGEQERRERKVRKKDRVKQI